MDRFWTGHLTGLPAPFDRFPPLFIISGHRTASHNREVGGAPDSRHVCSPSLAADLRMGRMEGFEKGAEWDILGGWWKLNAIGGRWGGSFRDPDPNHFDLG